MASRKILAVLTACLIAGVLCAGGPDKRLKSGRVGPGFAPMSRGGVIPTGPRDLPQPIQRYAKSGILSSGGKIYQWVDSVSGKVASQTTGALQPDLGGDGSAYFNGDFLNFDLPMTYLGPAGANWIAPTDRTYIFKLKWTTAGTGGYSALIGGPRSTGSIIYFATSPAPEKTYVIYTSDYAFKPEGTFDARPALNGASFEVVGFGFGASELNIFSGGEKYSVATSARYFQDRGPEVVVGKPEAYTYNFIGYISDILVFDTILTKDEYKAWSDAL